MSRKKANINVSLLINTVSVQTYSNADSNMIDYITTYIEAKGLSVKKDEYGNLYVTKGIGPYVCLVSHIDTVHTIISNFKVYKHEDTLFAFNGLSEKQYGIGGDDKVGVFCNLQSLDDLRSVKLVFFRNEEIGCLGSNRANMKFFEDCNFVIQFDRRGNSDLITSVGSMDLCSKEFLTALKPFIDRIGYKETTGLSTDVATLKRNGLNVSAINLSCGYHNPHTDSEIIRVSEVDIIYTVIKQFIITFGKTKFEHKYVAPVYSTNNNYNRHHNSYNYDEEIYNPSYGQYRLGIKNKYKNFTEIHNSNPKTFRYIGNESIEISTTACPICNCKESCIYFLPTELEFYCTECNHYIHNPNKLFQDVIIEEGTDRFVFNWINMEWLLEKDAVYVTTLNTYTLKEDIQ